MLGEFGRFEEETAVAVADFLVCREGGFVIGGELSPDWDQISLSG